MSDFLETMAASSLERAGRARRDPGERRLRSQAEAARSPLPLNLSPAGFDLIAEIKLESPSEGRLVSSAGGLEVVEDMALRLAQAGAAALSVLTEPTRFGGELSHLHAAGEAVDIPVMRKDFLVDPIQVLEARAAGASGTLLITRILDAPTLVEMTRLTLQLGMFALVEIFDESDLEVASSVFDLDVLIGVNARDLTTLGVDADRHARLADLLPDGLPLVAESGVIVPDDAADVARLGYGLALVGTGLVTSTDPGRLAAQMIAAGRSASTLEEAL